MMPARKQLCTIAMPFGLYCYQHLPMGVNQSPDIAQEIMERVLSSIMEEIECYIDDIAAFSDDWESHKTQLNKLLTKLQNASFTVNPLKCEWAVQETDFLGHWLTPT
jgi:NADH dehydrogenase/NADH:ubiquinone oxidoreductase subunit G